MTLVYGVLATGWYGKPLETVASEIDADLQGILGASSGTEPDGTIPLQTAAGQLKTKLVDGFAEMWDLGGALYSSFDPAQNGDDSQDQVASITGSIREQATFSTVTGTCTGTSGTVLFAGRVAIVQTTNARFDSTADATITLAASWAASTGYTAGQRVTNAGNVYQCITSGTSAGSGGPTGTATDITDGAAHWRYLGGGTGVVDVVFQAEVAGPIGAIAGALNIIGTPVQGWSAVVNLTDQASGQLRESNQLFRARRDAELSLGGNTTVNAIGANILALNEGSTDPNHEPPIACSVFYNDTDSTDGNGLPPHSVEVLVQGGTSADIALEVWQSVGAGTATVGNQTSTVTDSQGNPQVVKWSRPVEVDIYVTATVYYDASVWPSDASVVQAALSALLTYTNAPVIGLDIRISPLGAAIMRGPYELNDAGAAQVPAVAGSPMIPGLFEVTPIYIGTSPSPGSSTTIPIDIRSIGVFDSSRCVITASSETP